MSCVPSFVFYEAVTGRWRPPSVDPGSSHFSMALFQGYHDRLAAGRIPVLCSHLPSAGFSVKKIGAGAFKRRLSGPGTPEFLNLFLVARAPQFVSRGHWPRNCRRRSSTTARPTGCWCARARAWARDNGLQLQAALHIGCHSHLGPDTPRVYTRRPNTACDPGSNHQKRPPTGLVAARCASQ
jgi:hypothetical protein